jgi:hypothetical protein
MKKIVLLGDSVATMLFDHYNDNDSNYSLACNQSITMVGQYILQKNYSDSGN